ncbi:MAG: enoyl-CoA hydratase-related protein [Conexivisphaerales archaeon]
MAEGRTVISQVKNSVMVITMSRPSVLNAINLQMGKELLAALREAEDDSKVRAVVLTGSGRAFTVGEDLNENKKGYEEGRELDLESTLKNKYNPLVLRLRRMNKPVIAAINGVVAGAGIGIALACDLRVAKESAIFHMAFKKVGLVPDSGTVYWLVKNLGLSKATELCFTSEPLKSGEAKELGLVNEVFPDGIFEEELLRYAESLAEGPTIALALTKRAINKALFSSIDEMLDYEAYLQGIAGRSKDHLEGVRAFFEKREPKFVGE